MGNPGSKVLHEAPDKASVPSTPISTPLKSAISDLDPRSPSASIVRTPIEVLATLQQNKEIDNSFTRITCLDPRSPTVEFTRTPIIVETKENGVLKLRNKNLESVRKQLVNLTPMKSELARSPKLLESSPISPDSLKKRNSVVGLLETNIDYVETDLDAVILRNSTNSLKKAKFLGVDLDSISDLETQRAPVETENKNSAPENDVETKQDLDLMQKESESENEMENAKNILESDANKTTNFKVEVQEQENEVYQPQNDSHNMIEKDFLLNELDKKLTNLIFEDKHLIESPVNKMTKRKEGTNNRTPLGNKNGNGMTKSVSKLRVHDKPTIKGPYAVSKIPVFKEKKNKGRFQCENTPPINRNVLLDDASRIKKSQWDADNTLII